ncbi:MFS general substrate transporter, partial [Aureobasidium melanogenum]|uniref:MFS general substrate transporter n=1 Tax=Aureobasidium melanogenum (strain CBS 110374) TaxID=1043003 RepID=A0A074W7N4_AURM1
MSPTITTPAAKTGPQSALQDLHHVPPALSAHASSNNLEDNFAPAEPPNIVEASRIADSTVPEGGYGWVVIVGCATLTWWYLGMSYSWGIMQSALVERGLSSASTLSFIGSLCVTFNSILALAHARFIRLVGTRQAALVGIICLGSGSILSGFCTESVGGLFFTSGAIMGIGTSLCFMLVSVTPAQYFNRKRGLAIGLIYAAGGLGGTALTLGMSGLIKRVGPAWTFRILGFMILATGVPAAFVIKERVPIKKNAFVDRTLLKDFRFLTLFVAGALSTFYLLVPPFFLPLYCNTLGLSETAGAGLVAAFNFSSAVGRLLCGLLCDKLGPVNTLFISLLLNSTTFLVVWPFSTTLGPLIVFVILNGLGNGGFFSATPPVVSSLFGSLRMPVVMGMIITGWGTVYLMGAPIAGYLLGAYGGQHGSLKSYHPAIFFAGSAALAACLSVGLVRLKLDRKILSKI